jgi:hypothetical protein
MLELAIDLPLKWGVHGGLSLPEFFEYGRPQVLPEVVGLSADAERDAAPSLELLADSELLLVHALLRSLAGCLPAICDSPWADSVKIRRRQIR